LTCIYRSALTAHLEGKMSAEIKAMWHIFGSGTDCILELRALAPKGFDHLRPRSIVKHFKGVNHPNTDSLRNAFEQEALRLNEAGYNVYIVMNPIRPDFDCGAAAKDEDIEYRDLLLIDIDRAGDTTSPANKSELDAAQKVASQVAEFLSQQGWSSPLRVMSGNGYHLYYVLSEVPNTPESKHACEQVLEGLAAKFNTRDVKIDTSVFNASRITKVPGTVMRKGNESAERPYRTAVVL
jgi:hypothetical protein